MKKLDAEICKFNITLFLRAVMLLSPVLLLFYQENGLTVRELFFFQGIFYLVSIIFDIPIGYFSNTKPRKYILMFALTIFFGISLLWLFFKGYYVILAGEILFAVTKTIIDNVPSAYLYDYLTLKNKKMQKYWGYSNFYISFGTALGSLAGAYLYSLYGSKFILIAECVLIATSLILVASLPNIKPPKKEAETLGNKIKNYIEVTKNIYKNKSIRYYIFYSGLLASYSAMFALGFQPLMKNALFPVVMFGVIAFINHFVRSCSGIITGKWLSNLNIRKLIIPLFILYLCAFGCIFAILNIKNIIINFVLLLIICLIIGVQLVFLILHVSRLHKFVPLEQRGSLMSVNNCVARLISATVLISSRFFMGKVGLSSFFVVTLCVFLIFGSYTMVKSYQIKE